MKGYGMEMTSEAAVREIAKDEIFYFHSGGGVTISGGEPFEQAEFVHEILAGCGNLGIHCAIETSFFTAWEKIERTLPMLGLIYADLKHPLPDEHRRITGVDNGMILDNIRRADGSPHGFDLVVRTPLVPGINDSDEAIEASALFVKNLKHLRAMEFLAYHRLGTETYRNLGMEYPLTGTTIPNRGYMTAKARLFRQFSGVPILINGIEFDG
jgi:pyruvate formate lyase activating enzyme